MPQNTIPQLFEDSAGRFPQNIMIWEKKGDVYKGTTYEEMRRKVHEYAAGLMALGLKKGDRTGLISEGRNDWVMSELAILYTGAVNVPLSVKIDELSDLEFRLAHSGCRMAVVSANQLKKIRQIKKNLPDLKTTLILDEIEEKQPDEILLSDIMEKGRAYLDKKPVEFNTVWQSIKDNDYANICYTSGTTADPKGIILTHRNYTANIEQSSDIVGVEENDLVLLILPWDHAFAHTCGIYTIIKNGASLASVQLGKTPLETIKNVPVNIKEIKPTILLSVPALAKNFRKNIEKAVHEKGAVVEKLFKTALGIAYRYNGEGWNRSRGFRKILKPFYGLFDKILFSKIRENFGGRLKFFVGGGALLDIELQRFFYAVGVPMYQGYGLTEAAPVISANVARKHKLGSSGAIVKGMEVKICDENDETRLTGQEGEIVVKGENIMAGYWKNEKATKETLKNGWLYTGDLGYLDKDGFLYVLGRFKSLLIASDGEKYSPEGIEETITENSPYIDQVMIYNNQSPYTSALVVPNKEAILGWLKDHKLSCKSQEGREKALKMILSEINKYRENPHLRQLFPQRWLPSAVGLLDEPFTEQNLMLNSTLKMVRSKITEFYKDRIDYLYTQEAKDILNSQNLAVISRLDK